jgi:uroporphyrin-III C-methyltransferase
LLAHLPADTPAAVVQWAGSADEQRLLTRLDRLAGDAAGAGFGSPAVILVGSAVGESVDAQDCARDRERDEAAEARAVEAVAHAA